MFRGQFLGGWATLAAGLAVGALAHVAPGLAVALLLAVLAGVFRIYAASATSDDLAPLMALALVACAALIGGPQATIGAALVWRTAVELHIRGSAARVTSIPSCVHLWSAPAAALLHRLDAPQIFVVAAVCVAGVAWTDWLIRRLAEWRLDTPAENATRSFVGAQAALLAPLLVFPAPQTCLAALVAMGAARAINWRALPTVGYATAR